ncbi:MAG: V4R domain-containing protein [Nanoarchaeota archaeon]
MISSFLQKLLFVKQFDMINGKIEILGNKYIMLDSANLLVLQNIDKTKMYQAAKDISKKNMKEFVEHAEVYKGIKTQELQNIAELAKKIGKTDEGMIKTLQMIFEIYGLGKLEIIELDNENHRASLKIIDSTLALAQLETAKTKSPVCTLTAGILAGIFTYIFNKNVECVEIKCMAKGDDNCQFKLS